MVASDPSASSPGDELCSRASVATRLAFCVATEKVTSTSGMVRSARRCAAAGMTSATETMATAAGGTVSALATPDTKAARTGVVNVAAV
jgi:hypothetical protein